MNTLAQLASVLDATWLGGDTPVQRFSTDTRQIAAGDLFVALRGPRFDGADFAAGAVAAGAVGAVVMRDSLDKITASPLYQAAPFPLLGVDDTRLALGQLAAHWRDTYPVPLIGLTGSNGKTTVKEMIAAILRQAVGEEAVLATQGNLNNDIGMPLMLGRLHAGHRYAVLEMGMNHAGEIDYLTQIARPNVALINNASGAHLAGLGSVAGVAEAKGEILAGLAMDGIAVLNADDAHIGRWRELAGTRQRLAFGLHTEADISAVWHALPQGAQLEVTTPAGSFSVTLQVCGEHNVRNALAATAACLAVGIALSDIAAGLAQFTGVAGRQQPKNGAAGATLLDDTYNANPASMRAAIEVLSARPGRRVLIIGDMGELGADAPALHAEVGALARNRGIDVLLALGEFSAGAVAAFGAGGQHFADLDSLLAVARTWLAADTTLLIKGSRFMKMERVVAALQADTTAG